MTIHCKVFLGVPQPVVWVPGPVRASKWVHQGGPRKIGGPIVGPWEVSGGAKNDLFRNISKWVENQRKCPEGKNEVLRCL